jgi:hypothetical protein
MFKFMSDRQRSIMPVMPPVSMMITRPHLSLLYPHDKRRRIQLLLIRYLLTL